MTACGEWDRDDASDILGVEVEWGILGRSGRAERLVDMFWFLTGRLEGSTVCFEEF